MIRTAVLASVLCVGATVTAAEAEKPACNGYGTTIAFLDTPREAAHWSTQEGKLVFVLHVSGHFEDPRFT